MLKPDQQFRREALKFIRPYFKEQIFTLICVILGSVVSLLYPLIIKIIIDDVLVNKNTGMLLTMLMVYIGLFLLGYLFRFLTQFMNTLNTQFFSFNLKKRLFIHLENTTLSSFGKTNMGEIMSNFNSDIDTISRFLSTDLLDIITNTLNIVVVIMIFLMLNWKLALLLLMVMPFFYLSLLLSGRNLRKIYGKRRNLVFEGNQLFQNVFTNIKLVKLLVAQRIFTRKFLSLQDQVINTEVRATVSVNLLNRLGDSMLLFGNIAIIWYGANLVFQDRLTIGGLMAFYTYMPALFSPIGAIVVSSAQVRNFETSLMRILQNFDLETEKSEKSWPRIKEGKVDFDQVVFGYNDQLILNNININIQPGDKTALIGKNGSGKTTLVNLLLKLYQPKSGNIRIDNIDLPKYSTNYLRKNIGIVTQEVNFFNLSIEENFKISSPRCTTRDIINACKITGAHQFIDQLPDGYQTVIGERGCNFSGGQLQKLAISRLILKNPPIIIFDEATSSLDPESTIAFYNLFQNIFKENTIIFILHDLKNVVYADKIILLNEGTVGKVYLKDEIVNSKELVSRLTREIA